MSNNLLYPCLLNVDEDCSGDNHIGHINPHGHLASNGHLTSNGHLASNGPNISSRGKPIEYDSQPPPYVNYKQSIYSPIVKVGKTFRFFHPGISFESDIVITNCIIVTDDTTNPKNKKDTIQAVYMCINGNTLTDVVFSKIATVGKQQFDCRLVISKNSIISFVSYIDIGPANLTFSYFHTN